MTCVGLRMFYDSILSLYSGVYILDQVYILIHFMSLRVKFIVLSLFQGFCHHRIPWMSHRCLGKTTPRSAKRRTTTWANGYQTLEASPSPEVET